jgi:hypothetical protein
MIGYGLAIGLGSSLMGIRGGLLATMVLTLYGKPIHNSRRNLGRDRRADLDRRRRSATLQLACRTRRGCRHFR